MASSAIADTDPAPPGITTTYGARISANVCLWNDRDTAVCRDGSPLRGDDNRAVRCVESSDYLKRPHQIQERQVRVRDERDQTLGAPRIRQVAIARWHIRSS